VRGELINDSDARPAAGAALCYSIPHHTRHSNQLAFAARELTERPSGGGSGECVAPERTEQGGGLG
jgi:hypothetical protein